MSARTFTWSHRGPSLDEARIVAFETRLGVVVPRPIRSFLMDICNGGYPGGRLCLPVFDSNERFLTLHGVFGIDHPDETYSLERALNSWSMVHLASDFFPFGFDDVGGEVLMSIKPETFGQLYLIWLDELAERGSEYQVTVDDALESCKSLETASKLILRQQEGEVLCD